MTPEQAMGEAIDKRSDIFSAAAVFYFMVTKRAPFGQTDLPKVLNAVMHSPPAAIAESEAPEPISRMLLKGLEKRPDDRYQSLAHMRAEIDQVRRVQQGQHHRVARAALDRYRQIEALIEERRAIGRRLRISEIDRICDETATRLAQRFPDFARVSTDDTLVPPIDSDVATAALVQLQTRHNAEVAAVAVLRAADGADDAGGSSSLKERASALLHRLRTDRNQPKERA
jgi:hypothetical protein